MDPNTAWSDLSWAVENDDWQAAAEIAENLVDWIGKAGSPPTITGFSTFDLIVVAATAHTITALVHP